MKIVCLLSTLFFSIIGIAQQKQTLSGVITANNKPVSFITVTLQATKFNTQTDSIGRYKFINIPPGNYTIRITEMEFQPASKRAVVRYSENVIVNFELQIAENSINEVVVSGTLKPVRRLESPVPVEVYSPTFFKKNPSPSIYEALQNINGVRPQLNCGVCNTGDIHINGLEGPYTLVLIDGMPIVSSLSTVYGLSGIPNSLVERIEIVKGPASSLYGSEAVGGLINIITKNTKSAAQFSADVFTTSWLETNVDLGFKFNLNKKITALFGLNYFKYNQKIDNDNDGFTDVTLSDRISVFQKWNFNRKNNRVFTLASRSVYEDRYGGDIRWEKKYRGGNEIYGESIYTKRGELLANYQLPTTEKILLAFSGNIHYQDSRYGTMSYIANQKIAFTQLTWDKKIAKHDLLTGFALRYNYYDDNTAATQKEGVNNPEKTWLPGIFVQDEIAFNDSHKLLLGLRYDYNSFHGTIFTPRLAYKLKLNENNIVRLNAGTGFRVVNLFTEDHAALTGAREVVINNDLKPEQSVNVNFNYIKKFNFESGTFIAVETSVFYTRFSNKIVNDYVSDPNKIIYDNINGYAISKGISTNIDINFANGLKIITGVSFLDNKNISNGVSETPVLTEPFTGTWSVSYKIQHINLNIDYTGNIYGSMRLPLVSNLDPRAPKSPIYSIQNLQFTFLGIKEFEIYAGIKNLLNFLPKKNNPFLIANANDPFDNNVQYNANGQVVATAQNPYGLTFDTTYIYAQNQGIRSFFGLRYTFK